MRNVPPIVEAGPDQEKVAGDEVRFAGQFTDPSSPTHVLGWDFGAGSEVAMGTLTPTHTYTRHGVYTVRLVVTDSHLASANEPMTVTVISSYGCVADALARMKLFVKESERPEKVIEFKKLFNNPKSDSLSAGAFQAIGLAVADVIRASRLISETLYLENETLQALDPRRQKSVNSDLARAKEYLEQANALVEKGDYGTAVRRHISSWNNTLDAIETAGRSQPSKELAKALDLIEESLAAKYWLDDSHLNLQTGTKAFDLMQSAARELANAMQDAAKGRVIPAVGLEAARELADLLERARRVSRTLHLENERLTAVNPKNQKSVESELKQAKADLDQGLAAEAASDLDNALTHFASAWDHTIKAIAQAAKK